MKEYRNPQDVHAPLGAYTHQVELHGERLLVMSGQVGMDQDGTVPEGTIAQLNLALDNVRRNLVAAGLDT
ncbi:MAG: RidA family protein, partial [Deltaproteobacteria bacterium]